MPQPMDLKPHQRIGRWLAPGRYGRRWWQSKGRGCGQRYYRQATQDCRDSSSLTVDNASVKGIDGKLDITITTSATDTVANLVTKLNAADDSLSANVLSLGNSGVRGHIERSNGRPWTISTRYFDASQSRFQKHRKPKTHSCRLAVACG